MREITAAYSCSSSTNDRIFNHCLKNVVKILMGAIFVKMRFCPAVEQSFERYLLQLVKIIMRAISTVGLRFCAGDEQSFNHCLNNLVQIMSGAIPPGLRFCPTEEQIFNHYLLKKNCDPDDISVQFVKEIDLLKHEPPKLRWLSPRQREDEDWYFFYSPEPYGNGGSSTKKRARNGDYSGGNSKERLKRSTATGYWKSTGEEAVIKGFGGKRILVFHVRDRDSKKEVRTDHIIHEYYLNDIPADRRRYVLLRLKRSPEDKITSNCEADQCQLLASNFENSVATGNTTLEAVNPPCSPSEIYDGLNSISPMQSADALEDSSLVDLHTDTCSPNEGQLSQDTMHSSGPVEGLPNHHQLALDSRNDNIRQKLKRFRQLYVEFEKELPPQESDQGQSNQHLTFDSGDSVADNVGVEVDPRLVEPGTVEPPSHRGYEPSNSKRFNNDIKSNNSQFEHQIDEEDCFADLETLFDIDSPNSIGDSRNSHLSMGKGIFSD